MRYNHFHDQLVLTSSSDARLVLTSVASISSEPDGHLGASEDDIDSKKGRQVLCLWLLLFSPSVCGCMRFRRKNKHHVD